MRFIAQKRRRVKWLSASNNQYQACLSRRPLVFTSRFCKLVSDQCSIFLGSTNRRHVAASARGDTRSLEVDLQRSVERKLKRLADCARLKIPWTAVYYA
jgi:hypothetical protein